MSTEAESRLKPRYAGVLLHPTSFPSKYGIGDMGKEAFEFIDFLKKSGQKLWQVLPLGPTGFGDSPYQSFSSFAGQPLIISPDRLIEKGLLMEEWLDLEDMPVWDERKVDYGPVIQYKMKLLKKAFRRFKEMKEIGYEEEYHEFCSRNKEWLDDYALFMAAKDFYGGKPWMEWGESLKHMTESSRAAWENYLEDEVKFYKFIQYVFFEQWFELKNYANGQGIKIIGDIPIFVSMDSADVWANQKLFQLNEDGYPTLVAGVPPDYFSATGQLWGNPLYDWDYHEKLGYDWWIRRLEAQLKLVDYLRIDHFRGFESYWAVPYGKETAIEGEWLPGPREKLFEAMEDRLGARLPIIAEDLGVITEEVIVLRDRFGFPGMKVLQFGFEDLEDNTFLPYRHNENCVCYTGTHDNDTTVGWYQSMSEEVKDKVRVYMNTSGSAIQWDFIRCSLGSSAKFSVVPMQDLFGLGTEARMNRPGTAGGNWGWRYAAGDLNDGLAEYYRMLTEIYGR